MKIKISEVNQMIKEEFQKMMEKKKLSSRLNQINEELNKMEAEDKDLNEVEAGGQTSVASHAWTGKEDGDKKWKPEFEKKGTHLKEDDMPGEETDMPGEEVEEKAMGEFEAKFAEIGKAIDTKLASEIGGAPAVAGEPSEEPSEEDFEEVEVETPAGEEEEKEGEIEEYKELVGGVGAEQGVSTHDVKEAHMTPEGAKEDVDGGLGTPVKESVEEPLEGHSVAQEADADKVNDNMEKDKHVKEGKNKEGKVITEAKTTEKKNIFTEGLDDKKKASLLSEMNRMKKFAGLSKDEE